MPLTPVFVLRALHLAVIHQHEPFLDFLLGFAAGTEYLDLQNDLGQVSHRGTVSVLGARILSVAPNPFPLLLQTALHLAAILEEASTVEKLYAAGAGLCVAERGGHTALHLACRVGAHACARVLLQPRPRRPRGAPSTYLAQDPDHTPNTDHTPVALYPDPDLEKEEDESEEDWKLQLEAENYEGEVSSPRAGPRLPGRARAPALSSALLAQDPAPWEGILRRQGPTHHEQGLPPWPWINRNGHVGPRTPNWGPQTSWTQTCHP